MKCKIIRPGKYADMRGDVRRYEAGEVLDTRDWYARSITDSGYAVLLIEEPRLPEPEPVAEQPQAEETKPEPEKWSKLPGITKKLEAEIHQAGIVTIDDMLNAVTSGKLISIVGITRAARVKQFYEAS